MTQVGCAGGHRRAPVTSRPLRRVFHQASMEFQEDETKHGRRLEALECQLSASPRSISALLLCSWPWLPQVGGVPIEADGRA